MSHQKNILWTYDINGKNIIWLHKGLCIQKRIEEARALRKEEKIVLQRKNVLGNILVKLQMDKDGVILSHPFTTQHSCITTSCGLSQKARKKRMFYRTFFTWNNTFFATLAHQATKQEHMGCFGTYKHNCMLMYISSELQDISLYTYKHTSMVFGRAYNKRIQISLSKWKSFTWIFFKNIQQLFNNNNKNKLHNLSLDLF